MSDTTDYDKKRLNALKPHGRIIAIRECQWKQIKLGITKRSPYSKFYYTSIITPKMILDAVKGQTFFGLLEVDISTPEWLQSECNKINFATIFNKIAPSREMLSSAMQSRCDKYTVKFPLNRQLTLVYSADNYLITSDMLKYYLDLGLQVSKVHYCIEYQKHKPLKKFVELGNLTTDKRHWD